MDSKGILSKQTTGNLAAIASHKALGKPSNTDGNTYIDALLSNESTSVTAPKKSICLIYT